MATRAALHIGVEIVRAAQGEDPFAFAVAKQEYLLRGADGGFETATLDWNQELLRDLDAMRRPGRDSALLERVGDTLRRFLSSTEWRKQEAQLLESVGRGQRVIFSLRSAAAELYALPWELLTIKATGQHLGELPEVLLRYEWPETMTAAAEPHAAVGRILVAWSAAGGAVPAAEHIKAIEQACAAGYVSFDAKRDVLSDVSAGKLDAALLAAQREREPIAVLHLLCHGAAASGTFGLTLDGDSPGESSVVLDAGRLRQLLFPHAASLRLVVLSACDSGNSSTPGNHLGSLTQTLHRAGIGHVIASRYPLSVAGSVHFAEAFYSKLLQGPDSLETAFLAARRRLAQDAEQLDWASVQLYARAADGDDSRPLVFRPFRGLLAFQPKHSRFFFGRGHELDEVLSDLAALRASGKPWLLVVAGASGSGKSSLVLAGVVPRLLKSEPGGLRFRSLRPGTEPLVALDSALKIEEKEGNGRLLLVVDQFEEIFTHVTDVAVRQSFTNRLYQLASATDPGTIVLVTLRVDFLGRCGEIFVEGAGVRLDRLAYDEAHRVFVAQMGPKDMQAAMEEPLLQVGMQLEEGLSSRMQSDIGVEPGALPLLEDTLDILWQRRQGRTLTQKAYEEIGGVAGALKGRADALIDACDEAEQRAARRLLVRLVNMELGQDAALATRRRVILAKLRPEDAASATCFDRVLAKLVEARLIVLGEKSTEQTVEVAHEALIRKWPRLHEWLRSDAGRLAALEEFEGWAKQWREHGTLLRADQILYAQSIAQRYKEDLSHDCLRMLAASRKRLRWRRGVAWMLLVFVLLLVCPIVLVFSSEPSTNRTLFLVPYSLFFIGGFFSAIFGPILLPIFLAMAAWRVYRITFEGKRDQKTKQTVR